MKTKNVRYQEAIRNYSDRELIAHDLIGVVAWWYNQSYESDQIHNMQRLARVQAKLGKWYGRVLVPIAVWIHKEAAHERMAHEGWWG